MKRLIIMALLLAATSALAAGYLQKDPAQNYPIQGFAPSAKKIQSLTINRSGNIDNRSAAAWSVYAPADCYFRIQSTATRAGIVNTAPGGTWTTRVVNGDAPYASYSGCTSGVLQRQ